MKITIISASPKKRFSASMYFSKVLRFWLLGHEVTVIHLKSIQDYHALLKMIPTSDTLVFAFPVYVDAIPSTLLDYLSKLQKEVKEKNYSCRVYGINICGFYEGHQCALALDMLKNWCIRANLPWCGGVGIGAGEMLSFTRILVPAAFLITMIELLVRAFMISGTFTVETLLAGFFPWTLWIHCILYILFGMGMFTRLFRLRNQVIAKRSERNSYTTVWFCPRWLFVCFASLYWVGRALIMHGIVIWQLFKRIDDEKAPSSR